MANLDPPRVIPIGGAPMSGKSTVARTIAARLGLSAIATDDLGAAARGATGPAIASDLLAAFRTDTSGRSPCTDG